MRFNSKILGLCEVASKDDSRPAYTQIQVTENHFQATDGFLAMRVKRNVDILDKFNMEGFTENDPPVGTLFPAKIISDLFKKAGGYLRRVITYSPLFQSEKKFLGTIDKDENTSIVSYEDCKANYPNIDSVFVPTTKDVSSKTMVKMNPKLMARMLTAFDKSGVKSVKVYVDNLDPQKPVYVIQDDSDEAEIDGLIMPQKPRS